MEMIDKSRDYIRTSRRQLIEPDNNLIETAANSVDEKWQYSIHKMPVNGPVTAMVGPDLIKQTYDDFFARYIKSRMPTVDHANFNDSDRIAWESYLQNYFERNFDIMTLRCHISNLSTFISDLEFRKTDEGPEYLDRVYTYASYHHACLEFLKNLSLKEIWRPLARSELSFEGKTSNPYVGTLAAPERFQELMNQHQSRWFDYKYYFEYLKHSLGLLTKEQTFPEAVWILLGERVFCIKIASNCDPELWTANRGISRELEELRTFVKEQCQTAEFVYISPEAKTILYPWWKFRSPPANRRPSSWESLSINSDLNDPYKPLN